jgi:DUF971 family protein
MTSGVSSDLSEIVVDRQGYVLLITWKDGYESTYPFDDLRRDCPCASCDDARSKRPAGGGLTVLFGLVLKRGETQVTDYHAVGWYALNFTWSDGHDTGIYTYDYLRARCFCEQCVPRR